MINIYSAFLGQETRGGFLKKPKRERKKKYLYLFNLPIKPRWGFARNQREKKKNAYIYLICL